MAVSQAQKEKRDQKGQIKLVNVRLSFPHLFKPQESKDGGSAKYGASFLIPKHTPEGKALAKLISDKQKEMVTDFYGPGKEPQYKPDKKCFRDGDLENWDGYKDHYYISSSNSRKPTLLDRDKTPLTEADGKLYAGCYVVAILRIWIQDHKEYGKRINASLEGVQFYKKGEPFGAAPLDADAFDEIEDDEDADETDGETGAAEDADSLL